MTVPQLPAYDQTLYPTLLWSPIPSGNEPDRNLPHVDTNLTSPPPTNTQERKSHLVASMPYAQASVHLATSSPNVGVASSLCVCVV